VKRLILLISLVMLVVILAKLPGPVVSDTGNSLADSNIPNNSNNKITTKQSQAGNSSASADITITMITATNK